MKPVNWSGNHLTNLRAQRGWGYEELSRKAHMPMQQIADYESGLKNPGVKELATLADAFGTTMDELMGRADVRKKERGDELMRRGGVARSRVPYPQNLRATVLRLSEVEALQPISTDISDTVERVVESLPECYKTPIILFYKDLKTSEYIAKELGMPEDSVKYILSRALERMRWGEEMLRISYGDMEIACIKTEEEAERLECEYARLDRIKKEYEELYANMVELYGEAVTNRMRDADEADNPSGDSPIEVLSLSTRAMNCLHRAGIETIQGAYDVALKGELGYIKGMGKKTADEIFSALVLWDVMRA